VHLVEEFEIFQVGQFVVLFGHEVLTATPVDDVHLLHLAHVLAIDALVFGLKTLVDLSQIIFVQKLIASL